MLKKLSFFLFFLYTNLTLAQDATIFKPDSIKRKIEATRINSFLKIDGLLKDSAWTLAKPYDSFVEVDPHQGAIPKQYTVAQVLYNKQFLYIGAFSRDSLGKKSTRVIDFKRDFNTRTSDYFGMGFDGFNDQRNCMVFTTNPHGVCLLYTSKNRCTSLYSNAKK